jgi:hypothetical protein
VTQHQQAGDHQIKTDHSAVQKGRPFPLPDQIQTEDNGPQGNEKVPFSEEKPEKENQSPADDAGIPEGYDRKGKKNEPCCLKIDGLS